MRQKKGEANEDDRGDAGCRTGNQPDAGSDERPGGQPPVRLANAMLQYQCSTCKGAFDEETVQAVLKRAAANTHGDAITPQIESAIAVAA